MVPTLAGHGQHRTVAATGSHHHRGRIVDAVGARGQRLPALGVAPHPQRVVDARPDVERAAELGAVGVRHRRHRRRGDQAATVRGKAGRRVAGVEVLLRSQPPVEAGQGGLERDRAAAGVIDESDPLGAAAPGDHVVQAHQDDLRLFDRVQQGLLGGRGKWQRRQVVVLDLHPDQEFAGWLLASRRWLGHNHVCCPSAVFQGLALMATPDLPVDDIFLPGGRLRLECVQQYPGSVRIHHARDGAAEEHPEE